MFKPFYVHYNRGPGKLPNRTPRGFTALVSPHPDHAHLAVMQGTFCSPKDEFNKKEGRSRAVVATMMEVKRREVPRMLSAMENVVYGTDIDKAWSYMYVLKNMV